MSKTSVGAAIAAFFKAKGYPDQASAELGGIVAPLATTDADGHGAEREREGLRDSIDRMVRDAVKKAFDEKEIEETKKAEEKKVADKKARDEWEKEESEKKKKKEEEEETGDTILEAEEVGHVINLGKVWVAGASDAMSEIRSRAEVIAPGMSMPTADACRGNKGTVLANFMRSALKAAHTKDAAIVDPFLLGSKIDDLRGKPLLGAFNGVYELTKIRNNAATRAVAGGLRTVDAGGGSKGRISAEEYAKNLAADPRLKKSSAV